MKNESVVLAACFLLTSGCAATKYNRIQESKWQNEPQIEIGQPNLLIDGLGNIVSIPKKIILLNHRVDNHSISQHTIKMLEDYIKSNPKLADTKVRINQFTPVGEFKRLISNKKISWWWRIFPGIPTTIFSLTGRLLGGDHYNPYNDTINIYSDISAVALHEAGHASDIADRVKEGWGDYYVVGRILPPVTLYQEYAASDEAINYLEQTKDRKEENSAYGVLLPAYGTYGGSATGLPFGDVIGAGIGHIVSIVPRYNNRLGYEALDNAKRSNEVMRNIKSDPICKDLIEESDQKEKELNNSVIIEARNKL